MVILEQSILDIEVKIEFEPPLRSPGASLSEKLYSLCLVLVGYRNLMLGKLLF